MWKNICVYLGCVCFKGNVYDGRKYFPLIIFFGKNEYFLLFGNDSRKYATVFGVRKENVFQIHILK